MGARTCPQPYENLKSKIKGRGAKHIGNWEKHLIFKHLQKDDVYFEHIKQYYGANFVARKAEIDRQLREQHYTLATPGHAHAHAHAPAHAHAHVHVHMRVYIHSRE